VTVFIEFDEVDEFSTTAVGEPGSRVFFLNARSGSQRVSVRCEKQQVKAISMYLRQVLSDLPPPEHRPLISAEVAQPAEQAFVLGPIGLGYDRSNDRLLVQLEEMLEADLLASQSDDADAVAEAGELTAAPDPPERGHIRFYVTRSQADAFCDHADLVVAAGRPSCVWCGNPIDPDGHPCPRMN
jgi:uncharacterized repeat protein (TIGR03847 family)